VTVTPGTKVELFFVVGFFGFSLFSCLWRLAFFFGCYWLRVLPWRALWGSHFLLGSFTASLKRLRLIWLLGATVLRFNRGLRGTALSISGCFLEVTWHGRGWGLVRSLKLFTLPKVARPSTLAMRFFGMSGKVLRKIKFESFVPYFVILAWSYEGLQCYANFKLTSFVSLLWLNYSFVRWSCPHFKF